MLGLLLPILVFIGMVLGYNYGIPFGDFSAAIFAGIGSIVGLLIATVLIVKIALYWDKKILRHIRKPGVKRSERHSRET
jgi:branched-subunit amino acid ABC-type transport system permease component